MNKHLNRREFIVLSSTAAVGFAAAASATSLLGPNAAIDRPFISVGFWTGAGRTHGVRRSGRPGLLPATSLTTSDASLISTGARASIRGFWTTAADTSARTVTLQVAYPALPGATKPLYNAWITALGPKGASSASNPVTFNVPVDALETVDLIIETTSGGVTRRDTVHFSTNPGQDRILLNRGVYVIALQREGDPVPNWSAVRLRDVSAERADPRGASPLLLDTFGSGPSVPFDYFLVSFDAPAEPPVEKK